MTQVLTGICWPDYDLPVEPGTLRAFVEAAEELGFDHLTITDHVLISGYTNRLSDDYRPIPGTVATSGAIALKREDAFLLLAAMAGMTTRLGFMTIATTLPKRQTWLVADMAATLDRLCGGRFRLGVGVGDEEIEFQLLGEDYHTRGARFEEQIAVLRRAWNGDGEPFVGHFHDLPPIDVVGPHRANPIPLWITAGDHSPQHVLERIGRLADGVIPPWDPGEHARASLEVIFEAARRAGRDPTKLGLEPKVALRTGKRMRWRDSSRKDAEEVAAELRSWLDLGATHIEFKTRRSGFRNLDEHVAAMAELQEIFHSCTS